MSREVKNAMKIELKQVPKKKAIDETQLILEIPLQKLGEPIYLSHQTSYTKCT